MTTMTEHRSRVVAAGALVVLIAAGAVVRLDHGDVTTAQTLDRVSSPRDEGIDYSIGDRLHIGDVDFGRARQTVVVFVTTNCQYCIDSIPPIRALIDASSHQHGDFRVVLVGLEPIEPFRRFLSSYRLTPDEIVSAAPTEAGVRTTPTIVVTDTNGVATRILIGQQPPPQVQQLLSGLRLGHAASPN